MAADGSNPSRRTPPNIRALAQLLSLESGHTNNTFSLGDMIRILHRHQTGANAETPHFGKSRQMRSLKSITSKQI
jgi:hypothetical protein